MKVELFKILLLILILSKFSNSVNAQGKEFKSFKMDDATLILLNDSQFKFTAYSHNTAGRFRLVNNEYHFEDTVFNASNIDLNYNLKKDSVLSINFVKIHLKKDPRIVTFLVPIKNGEYGNIKLVADSILLNKFELDSFYLFFLNNESKSKIYSIDFSLWNSIEIFVSDNVLFGVSLGNKIGIDVSKSNKILIEYYYNGNTKFSTVFLTSDDFVKEYKRKFKTFKKTKIWLD